MVRTRWLGVGRSAAHTLVRTSEAGVGGNAVHALGRTKEASGNPHQAPPCTCPGWAGRHRRARSRGSQSQKAAPAAQDGNRSAALACRSSRHSLRHPCASCPAHKTASAGCKPGHRLALRSWNEALLGPPPSLQFKHIPKHILAPACLIELDDVRVARQPHVVQDLALHILVNLRRFSVGSSISMWAWAWPAAAAGWYQKRRSKGQSCCNLQRQHAGQLTSNHLTVVSRQEAACTARAAPLAGGRR